MKLFEKVMYPVLIILVAFFLYSAKFDQEYYFNELVSVGGLVQWLTIWTLVFASIVCFYRAYILKPFRGSFFATCSIIFGFIYLIFALDEMSWGQIVFNFKSPEFFLQRNALGETNLRHLTFMGFELSDIIFTFAIKLLASLYFIVLPLTYLKVPAIKKFANRLSLPVPRYTQIAAYVIFGALMFLFPVGTKHVIFEFIFYWLLVLLMYNPLNEEVFSRKSLVR